jgi:methionyl-tRNA synthetase
VSRNISWGIEIPNSNQTIYVWIDALFNYITGIGGINNYNKELWENSLHIIGKDIIIFHGVYWPALLMAVGLQPPKHLFIHGWWLFNDKKMSKSLGNTIDPIKVNNKEYLRYFCLRQELLGHDGNFNEEHFISTINNELIGKILNLFYRFFSLVNKHYGFNKTIIIDNYEDREDLIEIKNRCLNILEKFSSKNYINELINISNIANEYIDKNKIWQDFSSHINYLIPLLDLLSSLLVGVLHETYFKIKSLYTVHIKNNVGEFTLIKLEPLFTKIEHIYN